MNTHELLILKDIGRIALARQMAKCLADALQVCAFRITSGSPLLRDLTKLEVPILTCPGRESNPAPQLEASTLEKSHSNRLLIAIRNICIWARDKTYNLNYPIQRTTIDCSFAMHQKIGRDGHHQSSCSFFCGTWRIRLMRIKTRNRIFLQNLLYRISWKSPGSS
jgi:hypothetical protein